MTSQAGEPRTTGPDTVTTDCWTLRANSSPPALCLGHDTNKEHNKDAHEWQTSTPRLGRIWINFKTSANCDEISGFPVNVGIIASGVDSDLPNEEFSHIDKELIKVGFYFCWKYLNDIMDCVVRCPIEELLFTSSIHFYVETWNMKHLLTDDEFTKVLITNNFFILS